MESILLKLGLGIYAEKFTKEKITPDIVCKLSAYEMKCLGVSNRSDMMALRMECVSYGNMQNAQCDRKFNISKEMLEDLLDADFKIHDISKILDISESTVYRRMRQYGLQKLEYSDVSQQDVEVAVQEIITEFPRCGETMIQQLLRQRKIKIPRSELRDCIHQVDGDGVIERKRRRIHRRVYEVSGPNHLWHIDTNHKLIRWNFVIVGGIDGFSRLVVFLNCTDNNKANTVLDCFKQGVKAYGIPLRVRSDMGMENIAIADFMIQTRGAGSMLTGKSTHNQRIERLWKDVYEGVLHYYYSSFHFMEDEGILDIFNDVHITALHYVFREKINEKLKIWQMAWSNHRIRTVKSSPIRLFTAGLLNSPVESVTTLPTLDISHTDADPDAENERPIFDSPLLVLSEICKHELGFKIPTDWESADYGIDVFRVAVRVINNHI